MAGNEFEQCSLAVASGLNAALERGHKPTSPAAQNRRRAVDLVGAGATVEDFTGDVPFPDAQVPNALTQPDVTTEEDIEQYLSAIATDDIRAALLGAGVEQSTIDGLSDAELRELFDQALKDVQSTGAITDIVNQQ